MQRIGFGIAGIFVSLFLILYGFTISASRVTPVTFGPPAAHAGQILKAVVKAVVIAAVVYVAAVSIGISSVGTTGGLFGAATGSATGIAGAIGLNVGTGLGLALTNAAIEGAIMCVSGLTCGGHGGNSNGTYSVAAGTATGGECYGPANSCGQAYKGTYESDPATGTMGCKISDSFTYGAPPVSGCKGPSVNLTVAGADATGGGSSITIDSGQSATLSWSSPGASYCVWKGSSKSYKEATSGSVSTGPLTQTTSFQMYCADAEGSYGILSTVTVYVLDPKVSITAEPVRVKSGSNSTITWSGTGIQSCTVTDLTGATIASGGADKNHAFSAGSPLTVPITTQSTFTITCQTNSTPKTKSVLVNVVPTYEEF